MRWEGALLVLVYAAFVTVIWRIERKPPALGEAKALDEAHSSDTPRRVGRDLGFVVVGVITMTVGATLRFEAVQRVAGARRFRPSSG